MRARQTTGKLRKNPNALAKGIGLLIVQGILSLCLNFWILLTSLKIAGCGDFCDYALAGGALEAHRWIHIGAFTAAVLAVIVLSLLGKESWWAPAFGIAVILLTTVAATIAIDVATAV
ncbi:hypothetical protein [Microbacterium sp.]|uniref:hypothetical protein n=1 Tax=Microbacterium sp. TaxID=51671 RepID=UPI0028110FA2|nr:hypothetical protein [Microbacterium sp.]